MNKIAIIGANGQLGSDLVIHFQDKNEVIPLTHSEIEISDIESCNKVLTEIKPNIIINTSAYHNVPKCEENPLQAFNVNAVGSRNLAIVSQKLRSTLIHYSTDYVFDGLKNRPYFESDAPNPLNTYGISKLAGEYFVKNYCEKHFIIRVSGLYGKVLCRAKGGNFITTMLKAAKDKDEVKVVNDEVLTPTSTIEIAKNTLDLLNTESFGLYHMTCEGSCSWFEFAKVIFNTLNLTTPLTPISVADFPSTVKRPFYSVLENNSLKKLNINRMPTWQVALIEFLNQNYL